MKKLIFSILSILVTLCASAQVNLVKVADYFDDFEITNFSTYYDTIYNNGNDVTMSVNVRFKLKKPFGTTNLIPNGSQIAIYYEPVNGNNIRTTINDIILDGQWQPSIGGIYSPYRQVNVTIPKEYLLSGNLRTYFISPHDPVANYWGYGISVAAKSSRKLTVVNVPNFIGPSQLCSEVTYTIERPGTVSLVNAAGIATLTALGNNQWKVSRIGGANGRVILRSTSNGKTFDKEITLGSPTSTDIFIDGLQGNLEPNTTYYFQLKPGFSIDSYNWSVIGGTIISGKNSNIVEVRTDPNPYNSLNNFQISLNYSGACGAGTIYHARYVNKGGGDPIDPGE